MLLLLLRLLLLLLKLLLLLLRLHRIVHHCHHAVTWRLMKSGAAAAAGAARHYHRRGPRRLLLKLLGLLSWLLSWRYKRRSMPDRRSAVGEWHKLLLLSLTWLLLLQHRVLRLLLRLLTWLLLLRRTRGTELEQEHPTVGELHRLLVTIGDLRSSMEEGSGEMISMSDQKSSAAGTPEHLTGSYGSYGTLQE